MRHITEYTFLYQHFICDKYSIVLEITKSLFTQVITVGNVVQSLRSCLFKLMCGIYSKGLIKFKLSANLLKQPQF